MHVVLKSSDSYLLKNEKRVRQILQKFSYRFFVRLYAVSVNTNHIHLCVLAKTREGFHHFERAVAGAIAITISSCHKGKPLLSSFWEQIIYSRLVSWGRDFENTLLYIQKNLLEATGQIPYRREKGRRGKKVRADAKRMKTNFGIDG
jgi:REP element-mobilizing transposase RayT